LLLRLRSGALFLIMYYYAIHYLHHFRLSLQAAVAGSKKQPIHSFAALRIPNGFSLSSGSAKLPLLNDGRLIELEFNNKTTRQNKAGNSSVYTNIRGHSAKATSVEREESGKIKDLVEKRQQPNHEASLRAKDAPLLGVVCRGLLCDIRGLFALQSREQARRLD